MIRLLFIDDDAILRRAISKSIDWEAIGVHLTGTASNCVEALDMIAEYEPDIVITDIVMPQISGLELCKILNREYPATKVILLSGYERFEFAQEAIDQHVFSYLTKPLKNEDLIHTVLCAAKGIHRNITQNQKKEMQDAFAALKEAICGMSQNWMACLTECRISAENGQIPLRAVQIESIRLLEELNKFHKNDHNDNDDDINTIMSAKNSEQVFDGLTRYCASFYQQIRESNRSRGRLLVDNAMRKIEENFADADFSLSQLAAELNVSYNYLSEVFKTELNENFQHCLLRIRIEHAKKLLATGSLKGYQVAERVGYSNPYYFSSCFKRYTGMNLLEYKQSLKKSDA